MFNGLLLMAQISLMVIRKYGVSKTGRDEINTISKLSSKVAALHLRWGSKTRERVHLAQLSLLSCILERKQRPTCECPLSAGDVEKDKEILKRRIDHVLRAPTYTEGGRERNQPHLHF